MKEGAYHARLAKKYSPRGLLGLLEWDKALIL